MASKGLEAAIPSLGIGPQPVVDPFQRASVELVHPFPTLAPDSHEPGPPKRIEMLGHRLARHRQPARQLAEGQPRAIAQAIQQDPPRRVGDGFEDGFHAWIMQP